jgi:hypothetical protein
MLKPAPPMTNAERQFWFRRRHPGYDRRRKARERASAKRGAAQILAALNAKAAQAAAIPAMLVPTEPQRLALPAPVVDPVMAELNALREALASPRVREALPVRPFAANDAIPARSRAA